MPRDEKWIKKFFNTDKIEHAIENSNLITLASNLFAPRYGNINGVMARGGTGADRFFYLSKQETNKWNISKNYLVPVLIRSRYNKFFTFTNDDWRTLESLNKPSYAFICHQERSKLPDSVKEFIKWGEKTELVRVRADEKPKTANQSLASLTRAKDTKRFRGWYDLVGVSNSPILASRRAQYRNRFVLAKSRNLAIDDGFITFNPKHELTELQLDAVLASLNSDMGRFFVEIYGRSTGGGVIELDDKSAGKIPIINIEKLSRTDTKLLANLFVKLESEARKIGEAETQESIERLQPIIDEINAMLADILGLNFELVERMKIITKFFFERRIARIEDASPEAVKGEEEPRITPPKKLKKEQRPDLNKKLTKWFVE